MRTITIGRANDCNIIVPELNNQVSNHHAVLTHNDDGSYLFQDTSSNGTVINGQEIRNCTVTINLGDEIVLAGQYHLVWFDIDKAFECIPQQQQQGRGTILGDLSGTIRSYETVKLEIPSVPMPYENMLWDDRYRLVKRLGNGATAQVWLAEDTKADNIEVAVKIFSAFGAVGTRGQQLFVKEFTGVHNLKHTNLLTPSSYDICQNVPYLISNYCKKGSALSQIGKMSEDEILKFLKGTAEGLNFLHQHDIVHQDIKPDNVLIDNENNYVLTDFGITGQADKEIKGGTPAYMAPEFFNGKPRIATPETDIWALGASVFELISGDVPFGDDGGKAQLKKSKVPSLPKTFENKAVCNIVKRCLDINPQKRPSAEEVLLELYGGNDSGKKGWIVAAVFAVVVAVGTIVWWNNLRTKETRFQNYVEKFGIPEGVGELTADVDGKTLCYKVMSKRGLIDSIVRINAVGKMIPDSNGYSAVKYFYRGKELAEVRYYGVCGKPLFKLVYESKNTAFIKNFDGTPKFLSGVAGYNFEYYKSGLLSKKFYCDMFKKPVSDEFGFWGKGYSYNVNGERISEYCLDKKGSKSSESVVISKHIYDENGLIVKTVYSDNSFVVYKNSNDGLILTQSYFLSNGQPVADKSGVHEYRYKYDDGANCIETTYYNTDNKLCGTNKYAYDKNGSVIQKSVYDKSNNLCFKYDYDSNGKSTKTFDAVEEKRKAELEKQRQEEAVKQQQASEAASAVSSWLDTFRRISTPSRMDSDYTIIDKKISGKSVTLTIKLVNYSKFQLNDANKSEVGNKALQIKNKYSKNKPSGTSLTVVVVDKSGREILTR